MTPMRATADILGIAAQLIADPANYSAGGVVRDAQGDPCDLDHACKWDIHGAVQHVVEMLGLDYRDPPVRNAIRALSETALDQGYDSITEAGDDHAHFYCRKQSTAGLFSDALRWIDYGQCGECGQIEEDISSCTACCQLLVCGDCVHYEETVPFYDGEESVCSKCADDRHKEAWTRWDRLCDLFGHRVAEWMATDWESREENKYKHLFRCTSCGKATFDDWSRYSATGGGWWCGCVNKTTKHVLDRESKINPATGWPYDTRGKIGVGPFA